jgi:hypothetical protein
MFTLGLAFISTSGHKLSDFGPCLDLRTRSLRLLLLPRPRQLVLSHLISEEEPSASHMCASISSHTYDRRK